MSKVSSAFCQILFHWVVSKPVFYVSIITFSEKTFWEKKMFMTLGCRTKLFLSKNSGGLEKSRFSVSIWKSDEKHDFWKKVSPTSDMQRKLVCFLSKLFQHYTARDIRVHKNNFKTFFFEKTQYFFRNLGLWSIFPGILADFFREGCQHCNLYI